MNKAVLVIMAAGMGSRYGGQKQIDPIDEQGHIIIDFSIYDAIAAGFKKVIFVIKEENREAFHEVIGNRVEEHLEIEYVYQDIYNIPEGFEVPENRVKPWGTAHAILSCAKAINGPFVVINADDYYGKSAFTVMYDYLTTHEDSDKYKYAMVGYEIENTLTENGFVSRGVCEVDQNNNLIAINERTHIEKRINKAAYTEDGISFVDIEKGTKVSMNFWGFTNSFLAELDMKFFEFLNENLDKNPLKCEFYITSVVDDLIKEKKAEVKVLKSFDRWYGVTYKEDKEHVVEAIKNLKNMGLYPEKLF
ncbi:MAG: nucleotidyltransferase [Clostridiales bacterium]|nr:nucleotidyltransferase [Clostridiales bacterium]